MDGWIIKRLLQIENQEIWIIKRLLQIERWMDELEIYTYRERIKKRDRDICIREIFKRLLHAKRNELLYYGDGWMDLKMGDYKMDYYIKRSLLLER